MAVPLDRARHGIVRAEETDGGRMLEANPERLADYLSTMQNLQDNIASALLIC
jgi:hypothetical protein